MRMPLGNQNARGFSPLFASALACHEKITFAWPSGSRNTALERKRFAHVFRLLAMENAMTARHKSATRKTTARKRKAPAKKTSARRSSTRRWSQRVTRESDALDLKKGVFKLTSAKKVAASLKRSAEQSSRRKAGAYRSALSMLTFYINRGGKTLPKTQRARLERAKVEL